MKKKIVVITGANRANGIGLALVNEFNKHGAIVIGSYREPSKSQALLKFTEEEDDVYALKLDVTDDKSVQKFKSELEKLVPRVDVLINNAGMASSPHNIMTAPISQLEMQIEVHAIGAVRLTQASLPLLRKSENPKVVVVSSTLGTIDGIGAGWTHYAPCKTAANALTLQMASTLRSDNICVFAVHPGWVATDIGGYGAPLSPEQSAKGLYKVICKATMKDCGTFRDYTGRKLQW